MLTKHKLLGNLDTTRVEAAIAAAEAKTSGEICVSVEPDCGGDVEKLAWKAFERLGVHATRQRNGVLIFVCPARHRVVVLGDEGIHQMVGQTFWDAVATRLALRFAKDEYEAGLEQAIAEIGEAQAAHFPFDPALDHDALPNTVDFGAPAGRR